MPVTVRHAQFPQDNSHILTLFSVYAESLGIDLSFQNFEDELASFPGKYTSTEGGSLLIAQFQPDSTNSNPENNKNVPDNPIIGCVALRRNTSTWCEMKRLYVNQQARRVGAGEKLVQAIINEARELGYQGMRLDTLSEMTAAQKLYRRFGFEVIEKYYETPVQETVFMGLQLW